jgi:serine/threonine-protein kinase
MATLFSLLGPDQHGLQLAEGLSVVGYCPVKGLCLDPDRHTAHHAFVEHGAELVHVTAAECGGVSLNGKLLAAGVRLPLEEGAALRFGEQSPPFTLVKDSPPTAAPHEPTGVPSTVCLEPDDLELRITPLPSVADDDSAPTPLTVGDDRDFGFEPNRLRFQECGLDATVARQLSRRFLFVRAIRAGGMGRLLLVQERTSGRFVAMKVMHQQSMASVPHVQQFIREAVITARLQHPHVIPVYDLGFFEHHQLYYTMRFIEGDAFSTLLAAGAQGVLDHLRVLRCSALAVHHAHALGLWHRDLKPHNIMVGKIGDTYVIDWGLVSVQPGKEYKLNLPEIVVQRAACYMPDDLMKKTENALTTCSGVMGTPRYMPPEQLVGNEQLMGAVCDVWAFGVMLFESLTGRHPLGDVMEPAAISKQLLDPSPLPPPSVVADEVPEELDALCRRMLRKNAAERMSTLDDFIRGLEKYLVGQGAAFHTIHHAASEPVLPQAEITAVDGNGEAARLQAECERLREKNAVLMELAQSSAREKELLLRLAALG